MGIPANPTDPPPGNGLLLFFRVDDFDEALPRARAGIPARGGAAPEPEHGNDGVRPSGSGWLLRDGQCPLGLKYRGPAARYFDYCARIGHTFHGYGAHNREQC